MTWLLVSIVPPILWAIVNHTDKYLLSKTKHHSTVNVLMVYSTAFSIVVLPVLYYFARNELFANLEQVWVQILGGILITLSIYLYLYALKLDETSIVAPMWLLVPVFGYGLSYIFLGEVLTSGQLIACGLVVMGSLILSLEFEEEEGLRIKHGVLWLMVGASLAQALVDTMFKAVTIDNSLPVSLFWFHAGILLFGVVLVVTKKDVFSGFVESVKVNGKIIFAVNFVSEALSAIAYMVRGYAVLLVPLVVVMTLNGYQPVFVFILGVILTMVAPKLVHEKIKMYHLLHKTLAIAIILWGTVMLVQAVS